MPARALRVHQGAATALLRLRQSALYVPQNAMPQVRQPAMYLQKEGEGRAG